MKSTFLKGFLATAVIALLAGYGISKGMNNSEAELEGTVLANIEALADGESGNQNYRVCFSSSRVKRGYTYYDCGNCSKVYDEKGTGSVSKCFL